MRSEFAVPPGGTVTLVGFSETVGPLVTSGEIVAEIIMLPEKPLELPNVRPDVADVPLVRVMLEVSTLSVKSGGDAGVTVTKTWILCNSFPLVPVTFTRLVPVGVAVATEMVSVEVAFPVRSDTESGFTSVSSSAT